jgi:hypothetical protein
MNKKEKLRNRNVAWLQKEVQRLHLTLSLAAKYFNMDSAEKLEKAVRDRDSEKGINYAKFSCCEIYDLDEESALNVKRLSINYGHVVCPLKVAQLQWDLWDDLATDISANLSPDSDSIWNQMLITNHCYNGPPIKLPDPGYIIEKTLKLRELESHE